MKKYSINAEICGMPVVDMTTGHVIANGFTPYFNNETLTFRYFELTPAEGGEEDKFYLPFDAISFINNVCIVVNFKGTDYMPDGQNCRQIIGKPLSAGAGAVSLFRFGSVSQTDIDENGDVISMMLSDGTVIPIPRGDMSESDLPSIDLQSKKAASQAAHSSISPQLKDPIAAVRRQEDEPKNTPVFADEKQNQPMQETAVTAPSSEREQPVPKVSVTPGKAVPKVKKQKKKGSRKGWLHQYSEPLIALVIFYILYMLMQVLFIHSETTWW